MNKYTPVLKSTGERIEILRPEFSEGFKYGRSMAKKGYVTDLDTGKRYEISGKSCGTPRCVCDAWAVEVPLATLDTRKIIAHDGKSKTVHFA